MPDATHGVVRAVAPADLSAAGVRMVMTNSLHLAHNPGTTTVQALGGIKRMMGWDGPIATDSGGFQAYSIIRSNPKLGSIFHDGLVFAFDPQDEPTKLTPEKSIQNQLRVGSDMLFCLDDCTHPEASEAEQEISVERTVAWARRCKAAFEHGIAARSKGNDDERPLLFAVIQGGRKSHLRGRCAEALLEIGFDGYGYGGWPLDGDGQLLSDMLALTRELVPAHLPMHALGIGHPGSVVACASMNYTLFDSALPTRDARRGRLYAFHQENSQIDGPTKDWLEFIYINDKKYIKDSQPVSATCPCPACTCFGRGYLRHLAKLEDSLFYRLATIHNLTFMRLLTDLLTTRARVDDRTARQVLHPIPPPPS
jgi:queuine tRNA-ribosyltransferase